MNFLWRSLSYCLMSPWILTFSLDDGGINTDKCDALFITHGQLNFELWMNKC